jgi:hypothetical protein
VQTQAPARITLHRLTDTLFNAIRMDRRRNRGYIFDTTVDAMTRTLAINPNGNAHRTAAARRVLRVAR